MDHRLGNCAQEANGLVNLGAGYVFLGMYKQARSLVEQARDINEVLGARRTLVYSLGNILGGNVLVAAMYWIIYLRGQNTKKP